MQALERLIDADTFLTLERLPEYVDREYELIDGEMIQMPRREEFTAGMQAFCRAIYGSS